jgi:hypothetical protein
VRKSKRKKHQETLASGAQPGLGLYVLERVDSTVGHNTMRVTHNPESRFYAEAAVAIAKSAIFQAHAEDGLTSGASIMAAISCYYSLFHRGLAQMFLAPSRASPRLMKRMDESRAKGERLPNRLISHSAVRSFLNHWPERHDLFERAERLRSFANYGPRVGWKEDPPLRS